MTTIQVLSTDNIDLLRAAGVKRIHRGWYTVTYRGILDSSTVCGAKYNRKGEIK